MVFSIIFFFGLLYVHDTQLCFIVRLLTLSEVSGFSSVLSTNLRTVQIFLEVICMEDIHFIMLYVVLGYFMSGRKACGAMTCHTW